MKYDVKGEAGVFARCRWCSLCCSCFQHISHALSGSKVHVRQPEIPQIRRVSDHLHLRSIQTSADSLQLANFNMWYNSSPRAEKEWLRKDDAEFPAAFQLAFKEVRNVQK
jgi:hypothetical protein